MNIKPVNAQDIFSWADGTWCYRHELEDNYGFISDDYVVIPFGTPHWEAFDRA